MKYKHIMEYYSTSKRRKSCLRDSMNELEVIMLSEISQIQKSKCYIIQPI